MNQRRWLSPLIAVITVAYLTLAGVLAIFHNNTGLATASAYFLYPIETSAQETTIEGELTPSFSSHGTTETTSALPENSGDNGLQLGVIPLPTPLPGLSVIEPVHWGMPAYQNCTACHADGIPQLPGTSVQQTSGTTTAPNQAETSQAPVTTGVLPLNHLPSGNLPCLSCHVSGIPSIITGLPTVTGAGSTLSPDVTTKAPAISTTLSTPPPSDMPLDTLPPNHPAIGGLPCISCHPNGIPTTTPTPTASLPGTTIPVDTPPPDSTTASITPTTTTAMETLPPNHPTTGGLACIACHPNGPPTTSPSTITPPTTTTSTATPVTTTSVQETTATPTTVTTAVPTTSPADTLPPNHPDTGGLACITCHPAGIPATTPATQPTSTIPAPTTPTVQPTTTTTTLPATTTASPTTPPAVSTTEPPTGTLPPNHTTTGGLACTACHPNGIPTSTTTNVTTTATVEPTTPEPTMPIPTETATGTTSPPTSTEPPSTSTTPPAHYTLPQYQNCQSCHGSNVPPVPTSTHGTTVPATSSTSLLPAGHLAIGSRACTDCHLDPVATTPVPTTPHDHPNTHNLLCTYCHARGYDD